MSTQLPPRETQPYLFGLQSWTHCQTFPSISNKPNALGLNEPTGDVRTNPSEQSKKPPCSFGILREATALRSNTFAYSQALARSSPQKRALMPPALAAYCHSASVGKR